MIKKSWRTWIVVNVNLPRISAQSIRPGAPTFFPSTGTNAAAVASFSTWDELMIFYYYVESALEQHS